MGIVLCFLFDAGIVVQKQTDILKACEKLNNFCKEPYFLVTSFQREILNSAIILKKLPFFEIL